MNQSVASPSGHWDKMRMIAAALAQPFAEGRVKTITYNALHFLLTVDLLPGACLHAFIQTLVDFVQDRSISLITIRDRLVDPDFTLVEAAVGLGLMEPLDKCVQKCIDRKRLIRDSERGYWHSWSEKSKLEFIEAVKDEWYSDLFQQPVCDHSLVEYCGSLPVLRFVYSVTGLGSTSRIRGEVEYRRNVTFSEHTDPGDWLLDPSQKALHGTFITIKEAEQILIGIGKMLRDPRCGSTDRAARTEPKVRKARIASLPDLRWSEVTIELISDDDVRVSARDIPPEELNYAECGFKDGRRSRPDTRWAVLRELARHGEISFSQDIDQKTRDMAKAAKYVIAKRLKALLGIADDPFESYRKVRAYRPKFKLLPNKNLPDE